MNRETTELTVVILMVGFFALLACVVTFIFFRTMLKESRAEKLASQNQASKNHSLRDDANHSTNANAANAQDNAADTKQ